MIGPYQTKLVYHLDSYTVFINGYLSNTNSQWPELPRTFKLSPQRQPTSSIVVQYQPRTRPFTVYLVIGTFWRDWRGTSYPLSSVLPNESWHGNSVCYCSSSTDSFIPRRNLLWVSLSNPEYRPNDTTGTTEEVPHYFLHVDLVKTILNTPGRTSPDEEGDLHQQILTWTLRVEYWWVLYGRVLVGLQSPFKWGRKLLVTGSVSVLGLRPSRLFVFLGPRLQ